MVFTPPPAFSFALLTRQMRLLKRPVKNSQANLIFVSRGNGRYMATSKIENNVFCVFGARRTGTNYVETLLLNNFNLPVANLNKVNNYLDDESRPFLFDIKGSKHLIGDIDADVKFSKSSGYNYVFVVRSPFDWLDARIRYHLDILKRPEELMTDETFKKWIKQEYVNFYQAALDIVDGDRNDAVVCRYEDALNDLDALMKRIADQFGYDHREWSDVSRIVAPGGGLSGRSRSDHIKSRRVSDRAFLRDQIDKYCPSNLIDRLGY